MHALHHHRTQNGVTLSWLAEQLGIDRSTLWRYENGQAEPPKSILFHAAHLLHVSPDDLTNAAHA